MNIAFADFTGRLAPISGFSQGRTGKVFSDIAENNNEYIILKNNQPVTVLLSIKEYKAMQKKLAKMDKLLGCVENIGLLQMARNRASGNSIPLEDLVTEDGFTMEEIKELTKSVEFD